MFLLFHATVPLLLVFPFRKLNIKYNIFWLFIGSIISDVIDKPAEFFNIWYGRGLAHTLLFFIVTFITLQLITKDKTKTFSYSIGFMIHIVMDLPLPALFYPIVGEIDFMFDPYVNFGKIDYFMGLLLSNSVLMVTELIGFVFLTGLGSYTIIKKYIYNLNKNNKFYVDNVEITVIKTI